MKVTTCTVNKKGLEEIQEFLAATHKNGENFTSSMLQAWAAEAEFQAAEGNTPTIEVGASDSVHGYACTYTVSNDGLDAQVVEIHSDQA